MRASSRCSVHPSREAHLRCRSCGRWLCDGCAQHWRDRVWCSRTCRARWVVGRAVALFLGALRSPVHPALAIAVCAVAAGLLLSAVAVQASRLFEETRELAALEAAATMRAARPLSAELTMRDGAYDLDLTGLPRGAVMILGDGIDPRIVELDGKGRGSLRGVRLPDGVDALRLLPVDVRETLVLALPSPTATPTWPPRPSPSHTAAPEPTSTPTPSPPPSPPPSPTEPGTPIPATSRDVPSHSASSRHPSAEIRSTSKLTPTAAVRRRGGGPSPQLTPPVLHLIADAGNRIALTFDGGEAANGTGELLDLLDELHLRVTLFVTGEFIDRHPALVRRAVLAGHEVGNHTYSHSHLTTYAANHRHRLLDQVNREWLHDELRRTEEAFIRATGRPMAPLWRAPFGEENGDLRGWAMELGYLHVRWSSLGGKSLDSLDWVNDEHSSMYRDSQRIVTRLLGFPRLAGGIVLMHLSTERDLPPWRELPTLLDRLRERHLKVVTVEELLSASPTWRTWLERARDRHRAAYGDAAESLR